MSTIRDLIAASVAGEPATAHDVFDTLMSERIAGSIDALVPTVAQQIFGDVSEETLDETIRRGPPGSMFGTGGGYRDGGWSRPGLGHPARNDPGRPSQKAADDLKKIKEKEAKDKAKKEKK